jgi:hypothetical protein
MFWFAPEKMRGRLPIMTGTISLAARARAAEEGRFAVGAEACGRPGSAARPNEPKEYFTFLATERTQGMFPIQRFGNLPMRASLPLLPDVSA